jgi:probable rRNA maturation factor
MRRLNRQFAGKDRVTDVLSFVAWPAEARWAKGARAKAARRTIPPADFLGDIVIATGRARRQALDAGHSYGDELRVLALHGLLHLVGYDHETDDGTMARAEARLRRRGGLRIGGIARARPA